MKSLFHIILQYWNDYTDEYGNRNDLFSNHMAFWSACNNVNMSVEMCCLYERLVFPAGSYQWRIEQHKKKQYNAYK